MSENPFANYFEEKRNTHSIERVVGSITPEQKRNILVMIGERYNNQEFEELKRIERKKTEDEVMAISLADDVTNHLRTYYQLPAINVPANNIHIIRAKDWTPGDSVAGVYNSRMQSVCIKEPVALMQLTAMTIHEMIHFKSYNAVQVTKTRKVFTEYRMGLSVLDREGDKLYLEGLNEAITEEFAKQLFKAVFNDPLFVKEKKRTETVVSNLSNGYLPTGERYDDDVYYADKENVAGFGYRRQREMMSVLVSKLKLKYPDRFKNEGEVLGIFVKGMMTGNLLEIGKLVDGAFGKGTLRIIGSLDDNLDQQMVFVKSL